MGGTSKNKDTMKYTNTGYLTNNSKLPILAF